MANACGLFRTEEQVVYTDELAEQFAKEAGVPPRPQETRSEIDDRGALSVSRMHLSGHLEKE